MRSRFTPVVVVLVVLYLFHHVSPAQTPEVRSGPMVGYGEMTEVMLWVQLTSAGTVQYRFWEEGKKGATAALSNAIRATAENDFIVHTLITGLQEGRRFDFEMMIDGKVVKRPYRLAFQTQPLWQWRTEPPPFSVAFGSCTYINDPQDDRPGRPYGGDYEIFTTITAMSPDLMLWIGDNTYYREIDWTSESRMRYRHAHTRANPEMQPLLGATHNYAIWDDHDYGPNDADRTYSMRGAALRIFKQFWANHTYGTEEIPGVFGRFMWGDVEFFMLDNRYHRSPNRMPDTPEKHMFGSGQMQWLKESLLSSNAPFKIVVGGNQMLNPLAFHESFTNYSHKQQELLGWIKGQGIRGVLFLSGDRHHTELIRLEDPAFYPLYDFTSSPLTSGTANPQRELENAARVPGTLVVGEKNFGMLRFEGPHTDRQLTMECYDKTGNLKWSHLVRANELRTGAR